MALLRDVRPDSVPLQFMGIYPGSQYALDPEKHNFEITYPSLLSRALAACGLKEKPNFSDPEIMHYLSRYKLQLLFPPKYWKPLPWKLNGMAYREYAAETQKFYEELKAAGILTMLTDEGAIMAHLGGYQPREFAEQSFRQIFTGDVGGLEETVRRINAGGATG
jgi:hypothetical protein